MTIGAFVAELIWQDNLEVIVDFKANNCYVSLKISGLTLEMKNKNDLMPNNLAGNVSLEVHVNQNIGIEG